MEYLFYQCGTINPAVIAGESAFGKYTGQSWNEAKQEYEIVLKEELNRGKITKEEYDMALKNNDWATKSVRNKGIGYGGLNAVWEALQWKVGIGLNKFNPFSKAIANSGLRVGVNSIFNAADTSFRALADMAFNKDDKTFKEAFEEEGGWRSTLINFGVGLIGSTIGEIGYLRNPNNGLKEEIDLDQPKRITSEEIDIGQEKSIYPKTIDKYKFKTKSKIPFVQETINSYNEAIIIDKDIAKELQMIYDSSDEYVIGIHRAGMADPQNIINKGLWLTGDITSGVDNAGVDLNNNISFTSISQDKDLGFALFCRDIASASRYKTYGNEGSAIIVKIPKTYLEYHEGTRDWLINETYRNKVIAINETNNMPTLKPEFIYGYLKVKMEGDKAILGNIFR